MSFNGSQAVGTKAAKGFGELESMLSESASSEQVCLKLAKILQVRRSEIALLRLEKGSLRFIFPAELRSAGVLPLSGSAVAARTAAALACFDSAHQARRARSEDDCVVCLVHRE